MVRDPALEWGEVTVQPLDLEHRASVRTEQLVRRPDTRHASVQEECEAITVRVYVREQVRGEDDRRAACACTG